MPMTAADLPWKYSTKLGSAGHTTAQPDPNQSLGKYISSTQWTGAGPNDLFDDISPAESAVFDTEYRCVFVHNAHATLTLTGPRVFFASQVPGGANCEIGVDPTAASAIGSVTAQAVEVPDEGTAPLGVTFVPTTSFADGVLLGDLPPGHCRAVWIRRTATGSALSGDGFKIRVRGDGV